MTMPNEVSLRETDRSNVYYLLYTTCENVVSSRDIDAASHMDHVRILIYMGPTVT